MKRPTCPEARIFATMYFRLHLLVLLAGLSACRQGSAPADRVADGEEKFDHLIGLYESSDRDAWQLPDQVIAAMGDLEGLTVADLGAGSGYFSFRLLPLAGKVIALEIDPRFIAYLEDRKGQWPDSLARRLEVRLASMDDPHLNAGEVDVVLVVNTYMYLRERIAYLRNLRTRLRPGGRLLIVDYQRKPLKMGPPLEIRVAAHTVSEELQQAGFTGITVDSQSLPYQYMVSARVP
jgi:SAM-dependent methyltransferase